MIFKTFPLTVTKEWLDNVEQYRTKHESKHDFILNSVRNEVQARKKNKGDEQNDS